MASLLELDDVTISFGAKSVVRGVSFAVDAGERVALVGESGSGKTVTALSIVQLAGAATLSGQIRLAGEDLTRATPERVRRLRGRDVAMIFQEPMTALNPLFSIGDQIIETLALHDGLAYQPARSRAIQLLARTGIREPERRVDAYPHQLSGGERQRAMIAMAVACRPKLLIADEPTTALDMTLRARIVELLLELQRQERERDGHGMAILLITHDLPLVRKFAERVLVMERGELVEAGQTAAVFDAPQHPYTKQLLGSVPVRSLPPLPAAARTLLETRGIRVEYKKPQSWLRGWFGHSRFVALTGADLTLKEGETVGVVGESGSGKSTLAHTILGLIAARSGEVSFDGTQTLTLDPKRRTALRAQLQVVFQDPYGSLSPRHTIRQIVGEGLEIHQPQLSASARRQKVIDVLADVGLPASALDAYPHEFSGGQRQRIAIARALVIAPRVLVLDEPTSALDLSVQQQVLTLLQRLQDKYRLSYLLISHDLTVINALAHRVYVMKDGQIVESGETEQVIRAPAHPYTQRLVQASAEALL
ncbi:MAG: dipeptide ABC transporter ATP-binding protein [Polyangiales bacterium]